MNRQSSIIPLIIFLVLMATGFIGTAAAIGWHAHARFGPKPRADVITERILVPMTTIRPTDCTRNGLVEYYRACNAQKRLELVKP